MKLVLRAVVMLALTGALSPVAWAQAFFYREVPREGRLYVFGSAAEYEKWDKTGAMNRAQMRLGYGPAGETVLFDGETAVNLYNFRHGLPGEVSKAPATTPSRWSWRDGKSTFESEGFGLNLSNRMQLRFVDERPDPTTQLPGTEQPAQSRSSFRFARARMKLDGYVYKKQLEYEFQFDWADAASVVQDIDFNWDISGKRAFMLKLGQFKIPFGRQAITSAMAQEFVDRSIVSLEFEKIRDQGLQAWGLLAGGKLEYRAGVFNGGGRQRTLGTPFFGNDNRKFEYDARVSFQPWGDLNYSEADFESKDKPLAAIAVCFQTNDARTPPATGSTTRLGAGRETLGIDGVVKYRGFDLMAAYYFRTLTPVTGFAFGSNGFHVQAGAFLKRDVALLAARYARFDPTDKTTNNDLTELGFAATYFYARHNLKLTADWRRLHGEAKPATDHEARIQTQVVF